MKAKKILALLLAVLMLVALFSACSNNESKPDDQGSGSKTDDPGKTDDGNTGDDNTGDDEPDDGDAPVEPDMKKLSWLGYEANQWDYTMTEAQNFATWKEFMRIAEEDFGLEVLWDTVDSSAYLTTLNGLIASNKLPDSFFSQGNATTLADDTVVEMINRGMFASMDDILAYSKSAAALFDADGPLEYLKAWAMYEDGNWYYIKVGNNTAKSMDLSNSSMDQRVAIQVHGAYSVNIRQDWLNKLELSMPQTTEDFRQALIAFQANDVNDNGALDERYVAHVGYNICYQGVGQWFGLPNGDFKENPGTGVIEVPCLMEGYKPWLTYMNTLYNDGVILNNDGGATWSYGVYCGGDYCSAYTVMQDYLWRTETGDPDADYEPMPIIQGTDGVTPRFIAQECVAGGPGITFNADVDLEAAARFVDFTHSQQFAMLFEHGIEGIAYDWNEDGTITTHALSKDQDEFAAPRVTYLDYNGLPSVHIDNVWGIQCQEYASVDEAIANNECYTEEFMTKEEWQETYDWDDDSPATKFLHILSDFGQENFNPTIVYSFVTLPTTEEAQVISTYKTDLVDTYLLEMTTNAIIGETPIDQIDEKIQYAYDNLGLQEYYNVMQARYNRFLVAMGHDPIEIAE